MADRDPSKLYCPHCAEQFGHQWQGLALKQHLWEAHGIPGEVRLCGQAIKFPKKEEFTPEEEEELNRMFAEGWMRRKPQQKPQAKRGHLK